MLILPGPPKPQLTLGALPNNPSIAEDSCWGREAMRVLHQQSKFSEVTGRLGHSHLSGT